MSTAEAEIDIADNSETAGEPAKKKGTGGPLMRKTAQYAHEDLTTTWVLFGITAVALLSAQALAFLAPWPIAIPAGVVAGLVMVRAFIFFHDWAHGAIFRTGGLGTAAMWAVGLLMLNPPSVWKETHDYHHRNNAKLPGTTVGSYPIVTVGMWKTMTADQRWWYRFARSATPMLTGYVLVFMIGMCITPFRRAPKVHWSGPLALVIHFSLIAAVWATLGFGAVLCGILIPHVVSSAAGAYLFYAQHNFPAMQLKDRKEWDYGFAALKSSSMFDMNPLMHWFTGNIGYHHVHHLNHRIPFYRLPEAMKDVEELKNPGHTTWAPSEVRACLNLAVWDPQQGRMLTWKEVDASVGAPATPGA